MLHQNIFKMFTLLFYDKYTIKEEDVTHQDSELALYEA